MLVFACITPHPPLLLPTIGKKVAKKVEKTKRAMEKLEEDLYLSKPDILIVISPHGSCMNDAFTLNLAPEYETDLSEFGDITTKLKFNGEQELTSLLREASKEQAFATAVISEPKIDHGAAVPLYYLAAHLPKIPIIPVGFCELDPKHHLDFGKMLQEQISELNKRVAVVASGDLSHALTTDAPAGYSEAGAGFDAKIQELLAAGNTAGMLQLDKKLVADAAECGFRSFLILMGALRGVNFNYKAYSYEAPFGVGYLVANFAM
ncbi:AmmeMemoRadiSam system protein B [Patescibacteria group bacterium]|nr:MAG: AmmeMemoRadiSam system protein B [Patescibacteria group bacterium]